MTERASRSRSVVRSRGRHTGNASEDKPQTVVSGGSDPDRCQASRRQQVPWVKEAVSKLILPVRLA